MLNMVDTARAIAIAAHSGHVRKDGTPYIYHPRRVMQSVEGETAKAVAWLHDVVEDTVVTLEALELVGFPQEVLEAVEALTRPKGKTYAEYIEIVAQNPTAVQVKLADLYDNMEDQTALDPDEVEFFNKRYGRALKRLKEVVI